MYTLFPTDLIYLKEVSSSKFHFVFQFTEDNFTCLAYNYIVLSTEINQCLRRKWILVISFPLKNTCVSAELSGPNYKQSTTKKEIDLNEHRIVNMPGELTT